MKKLKRKTPFLKFLEECAQTGEMPVWGLCAVSINGLIPEIPEYLYPTREDVANLVKKGEPCNFWGSENWGDGGVLTGRRQTILCFAALLTGEYE